MPVGEEHQQGEAFDALRPSEVRPADIGWTSQRHAKEELPLNESTSLVTIAIATLEDFV